MINWDEVKWSKLNPEFSNKFKFKTLDMLFDGDHAVQNRSTVRKNKTISEVIKLQEDKDKFELDKKLKEKSLKEFKEQCKYKDMFLNLNEIDRSLFYSSDQEEAFWKVCHKVFYK